jgi:hypothetical protein
MVHEEEKGREFYSRTTCLSKTCLAPLDMAGIVLESPLTFPPPSTADGNFGGPENTLLPSCVYVDTLV